MRHRVLGFLVALALLAALVVFFIGGRCDQDAHGQPWAPREQLSDHINAGYQKQVEKLYTLLAEGYLTRPESEQEENVKFMRGLRSARRARAKAIDMIMREPWEVVKPLPLPPAPLRPSDAPRWHGPANTR